MSSSSSMEPQAGSEGPKGPPRLLPQTRRDRPLASRHTKHAALDWPWLLERLREQASSALGRDAISQLTFAKSLAEARVLQAQTSEMRPLVDRGMAPSVGMLIDLRPHLAAARKGEMLLGGDFGDVGDCLLACEKLRTFFANQRDNETPETAKVAEGLPNLEALAHRIKDSFDAKGELSTAEYPELRRLRQRVYSSHARIREKMESLLESEEMEHMLQDRFYTVRADRYVLPIKVSHKNVAGGIIHDASGSGQTAFIEPTGIIPLNNEVKLAEGELRREERRILIALSESLAHRSIEVEQALRVATELDVIISRARFSRALQGSEPALNEMGLVELKEARHPVLALRGLKVIPNDLKVGLGHHAVVISGPNTGGKTVALKTLGLSALMAKVGLHVPANEGSQMALFREVLEDIGDTQTIEGDLSTFSGHITTMRDIILSVDKSLARGRKDASDTLVLLDEIAVGTDPSQGAALAQAILLALVERGCRVLVTTHYSELKSLSSRDARFATARVEYDGLKPTYRLKYGTPGRSFALDIARGLGLPESILERAASFLSPTALAVEEVVGQMEGALVAAEADREAAALEREEAAGIKASLEKKLLKLQEQADRMKREKVGAFEAEVNRARREVRRIIRELQGQPTVKGAEKVREEIKVITQRTMAKAPKAPEAPQGLLYQDMDWSKAKVGQTVYLLQLKKRGTIEMLPAEGSNVEVRVGGLKVKVPRGQIRAVPKGSEALGQSKSKGKRYEDALSMTPSADSLEEPEEDLTPLEAIIPTAANTLDIRGNRVDEGLDALDLFLDKMSMQGSTIAVIIHGHGTGALRDGVRDHLRTSAYVERFQPGDRTQGGNGVTVLALS